MVFSLDLESAARKYGNAYTVKSNLYVAGSRRKKVS